MAGKTIGELRDDPRWILNRYVKLVNAWTAEARNEKRPENIDAHDAVVAAVKRFGAEGVKIIVDGIRSQDDCTECVEDSCTGCELDHCGSLGPGDF